MVVSRLFNISSKYIPAVSEYYNNLLLDLATIATHLVLTNMINGGRFISSMFLWIILGGTSTEFISRLHLPA